MAVKMTPAMSNRIIEENLFFERLSYELDSEPIMHLLLLLKQRILQEVDIETKELLKKLSSHFDKTYEYSLQRGYIFHAYSTRTDFEEISDRDFLFFGIEMYWDGSGKNKWTSEILNSVQLILDGKAEYPFNYIGRWFMADCYKKIDFDLSDSETPKIGPIWPITKDLERTGAVLWRLFVAGYCLRQFVLEGYLDEISELEPNKYVSDDTVIINKDLKKQPLESIQEHSIVCLECSKQFRQLNKSHLKLHNLTPEQYKKKYGLEGRPLVCFSLRRDLTERAVHMESHRNFQKK